MHSLYKMNGFDYELKGDLYNYYILLDFVFVCVN